MLREVRRSAAAIGGASSSASPGTGGEAIPRVRAIAQIVLTVALLPLAVYVVFGPRPFAPAAREAASGLLGAIVAFWLKD